MTKRLHVLRDSHATTCVIASDVASVNATHRHALVALAETAGLLPPIVIVSTSPIQSALSLDELGLQPLKVMR